MRHRADELTRGITRQLGIGVERDDVLHPRQQRRIADNKGERVPGTAQECIEVRELSSLALKTHPDAFLCIPASRTVEQEERTVSVPVTGQSCFQLVIRGATGRIAVLCVELLDAPARELQQGRVLRQHFLVCVRKIGQQSEMQVAVAIGQETNFQRLGQVLDVCGAGEHGGDNHQGVRCGRNARGKIHTWQRMRRHDHLHHPVNQFDCRVARSDQRNDAHYRQQPFTRAVSICREKQRAGQARGDQRDRAQIVEKRMLAACPPDVIQWRPASLDDSLEIRQPLVDQMEAHVRRGIVAAGSCRAFARKLERGFGHRGFRRVAGLGQTLDGVSVTIAGREIHAAIDGAGVLPQCPLDDAVALGEFAPVDGPQHAQTADAIGDGELIGRLLLISRLHQLFDGAIRFRETLLDPCERQCQRGALSLQPSRQFRNERRRHRRI